MCALACGRMHRALHHQYELRSICNHAPLSFFSENDSSPWMLKQTSRICSKHFVNGAKSMIATHPGYHLAIVPDVYKVRPIKSTDQLSRYGRWKKRDEVKSVATGEGCCTIASTDTTRGSQGTDADTAGHNYSLRPPGLELLCAAAASLQVAQEDKACQTDGDFVASSSFSVLLCSVQGNKSCTQVEHKSVCSAAVQCKPPTTSCHSGFDHQTICFTGYQSVKKCAPAVRDLCGVTLDVVALLMSIMPACAECRCDIPVADRVLMFLMKLGISYSSLAVLFSVSRTTVSHHSVLRTLRTATQKWTFRPPAHVIMKTMPECFKANYPGCSMIIDCTEVRTEQPSTVQQQRVLYSHYKGGYTLMFLVVQSASAQRPTVEDVLMHTSL
ncbi:uncharacterized protein LOC119441312 [Dermacentor silvarum]|uniref:uncharacterized protein LOC119441312 n=1 Tax=Dermacentor silvarum TaxID=543639 RepID=UPI0021019FE3|nr:uncharacterized protein LOC119441312 [Dermacentor silvarum]